MLIRRPEDRFARHPRYRLGSAFPLVVVLSAAICGFAFLIGLWAGGFPAPQSPAAEVPGSHVHPGPIRVGTSGDSAPDDIPDQTIVYNRGEEFDVLIRKPAGPPRVETGVTDVNGNPVTVSCSTCHATRQPNHENKSLAHMDEFHANLEFSHGSVSCLSCHNSTDYDALQLADGSRIEFTDVMTLCAQCHGPQMKDYQHNAHGGFQGHWDLSRGNQFKNNCVDCHHPHAPQFPKMQPTFKPQDRFLEKPGKASH